MNQEDFKYFFRLNEVNDCFFIHFLVLFNKKNVNLPFSQYKVFKTPANIARQPFKSRF